jgi:hypothetical protein
MAWGKTIKTSTVPIAIKDFKVFLMSGTELWARLSAAGIGTPMGMLDNNYFYTDEAGWKLILGDLVQNSNLYVTDKYDCDKFAMKSRVLAFERYGLNTCGFVIGDVPAGRHSFNLIVTTTGFLLFEPQNNIANFGVFPLNGRSYHTDVVLI